MKKALEFYPYLTLTSYLTLLHFKPSQFSDSIIILVLAGLCAYKMFLKDKQVPDYKKEFEKELSILKGDLSDIRTDVGRTNFSATRGIENVRF